MRKTQFANGEFYHVFNRGVDKREIFKNQADVERFLSGMELFNVVEPIGSIYLKSFAENKLSKPKRPAKKLVNFICYAINPNHYHFLLEQVADRGVEKLMHRLGVSHTKYFNLKHKRSGSLFGGKFKDRHVASNEYLLHLSAYINLNAKAHQLRNRVSQLVRSSWFEYIDDREDFGFCSKNIILDQFKNRNEYKLFAEEALENIMAKKEEDRELEGLLLEEF